MESERLWLRKFKIEDARDCLEFLSDKETCYLDGGYEPFSETDDNFQLLMENFSKQEGRIMIELKSKQKVIGTIYIRNGLGRVVSSVEVGYVLSPKYRRQGYMFEALNLLISTLFNETHVEMILAKAYERNIPSMNLLKKLGFFYEGRMENGFKYPNRQPEALECYYLTRSLFMLGKVVEVTIDRPIHSHHPTHKDLIYPINYGFVEGIKANDGEEQDAYVLGIHHEIAKFKGKIIAIIHRLNDNEDKWVISNQLYTKEEILKFVEFQEKYFETKIFMVEEF